MISDRHPWRGYIVAVSAILLMLVIIGAAGLEDNVLVSSSASEDANHWYKVWADPKAEPALTLPQNILMAMIPGPSDVWGGVSLGQ